MSFNINIRLDVCFHFDLLIGFDRAFLICIRLSRLPITLQLLKCPVFSGSSWSVQTKSPMSFGYCNIGLVALKLRPAPGNCCSVVMDLLCVATQKTASLIACCILLAPQVFVKGFFRISREQFLAVFPRYFLILSRLAARLLSLSDNRAGLYNESEKSQGFKNFGVVLAKAALHLLPTQHQSFVSRELSPLLL
jgi:hypothetical protein